MSVCFCPQALLLHGSLPEEDQDGSVSFGDNRANAEQQLVQCPLSANSRNQHLLSTLCEVSVSALLLWWCLQPSLLSRVGYCRAQLNLSDLLGPLSCRPTASKYALTFFHSLITLLIPSPFEGSNPQSSGPKHGGSPWSQGTVSKCN